MSKPRSASQPMLYRKNDKNQTVQWRVWAEKGLDESVAFLCSEFGQVDGKLRSTRREVTESGHEDSCYNKACQQVVKKWNDKQHKEGYVPSQFDAGVARHDNDDRPVVGDKSKAAVPVLPMLANKANVDRERKTIDNMSFPCLVQPKIDGFRCVSRISGGATLFSRTNTAYIGFASMRARLNALILPDEGFGSGRFYLDGEFFVNTDDFSHLSSLIKRGQHHADYDLAELQYQIFDCFDLDHMDVPYSERYSFLENLLGFGKSVHLLKTYVAASLDDVDERMAAFLEAGHEGLMLRAPDSPYVLRKRSKHLLKHKEFHDDEFEIVNYKEGHSDDAGTVVWQCSVHDAPKHHVFKNDDVYAFWVRPKGTREQRRDWFNNAKDFMGKQLTVTYQEMSEDNKPRFPVGKCIREKGFDYTGPVNRKRKVDDGDDDDIKTKPKAKSAKNTSTR